MSSYKRKLCLSNIYYLAKEKGYKFGDFESICGVRQGYFSRLNREDSTTNPGIEVLATAAGILGVTIDGLVSRDYQMLSSSEQYVMTFLDSLVRSSDTGENIWEREPVTYIQDLGTDENGNAVHPLYENLYNEDKKLWECLYRSRFYPSSNYHVAGDCFKLMQTDHRYFYLVPVTPDVSKDYDIEGVEYELYLVDYEPETICRSMFYGNDVFSGVLNDLYNTADESSKHVRLSPNVCSAIDSFMNAKSGKIGKTAEHVNESSKVDQIPEIDPFAVEIEETDLPF